MRTVDWDDDDLLRERLSEALREIDEVPPGFVESATETFAWRDIDAELAALVYDSELEGAARADVASLRALTFATSRVTVEITFMPEVMIGQIAPQCTARIQLHYTGGRVTHVVADALGVFTVDPPPQDPFVLSCQFGQDINIVTPLITP
jgi:hypothetical protein